MLTSVNQIQIDGVKRIDLLVSTLKANSVFIDIVHRSSYIPHINSEWLPTIINM